ncbi:hypothetical protein OHU11_40220 (plasmid) [Streptomyces sp. NBC_00257]|uniref:hypothetical protein n=1 Tax=unclassified Streptomyces TaxID=2593676 RepID=UPI00225013D4|nr:MULTISPECIES: hypothetical protein [unclassified Streptomyces]WTB51720.1 hypothetical protein OG832_00005 [Streptomyces sp. NBC_00826]WTH95388.1 hypothetical protein OIC43_43675 [Streptomyces sp. NBC_00825]WTI04122.1 hypothetical protein OHA23_43650 [Streptomyces sp. NBC_00822]MCX4869723.1 hypothetical protein [Streptomyces sp. NBC_00906]MCX4870305.1 hypothetical protein [Streptomyces sp. NBC_00906]
MRIRRILAAVFATAALAGLGLTGAATATAVSVTPASVTPGECTDSGGTIDRSTPVLPTCRGGMYDGQTVD